MLHITMPLATSMSDDRSHPEFHPEAAVEIATKGRCKHVNIQLQGAIAGEHATAFLEFLKAVSRFVGTRWTIQMKDLSVLSLEGITHLLHFAELLRMRGQVLEIGSIHRNVYAMLQDLKAVHFFAWAK